MVKLDTRLESDSGDIGHSHFGPEKVLDVDEDREADVDRLLVDVGAHPPRRRLVLDDNLRLGEVSSWKACKGDADGDDLVGREVSDTDALGGQVECCDGLTI